MIEDARPPIRFNAGSCAGYTPSRFSGNNQITNTGSHQVDTFFSCDFCQMQSISRRAQHNRNSVIQQKPQPGGAAQTSAGETKKPSSAAASNAVQKPR